MTENHYASSEVMSFYPFWHALALRAVNFSLIINGKSKDIMKRPLKIKTKYRNANSYWSYTTAKHAQSLLIFCLLLVCSPLCLNSA